MIVWAMVFLAAPGEQSFDPTHIEVPIVKVVLEGGPSDRPTRVDLARSCSDNCAVDLIDENALQRMFLDDATVPNGDYDRIAIHHCKEGDTSYTARVTGKVDIGGAKYRTSSGASPLSNAGGGKYQGQVAWPSNPVNITVKSSLLGTATRNVTSK